MERFYNEELEDAIRREVEEILSGVFAKDWTLKQKIGMSTFRNLLKKAKEEKTCKGGR